MSSNSLRAVGVALLLAWAGGAAAETLSCPELTGLVQVGVCPTEDELSYTFKGYCGDNGRLYDRGEQVCTDYALYRAMKNISLWETADGRFSGYLSCDAGRMPAPGARAEGVVVTRQGSVTRVACSYGGDVVLAHRTKAKCVAAPTPCSGDACQARCE